MTTAMTDPVVPENRFRMKRPFWELVSRPTAPRFGRLTAKLTHPSDHFAAGKHCEIGAEASEGPAGARLSHMDDKVNLADKLGLFNEPYSPKIVGYLNDYKLAVVKVLGEFVWHKHDDTDDFFLVLRGNLTVQLRDRNIELAEGELFVVPRGVEHCPKAQEEAHVLLIEPKGTINTGDAGGPLTAEETSA
jgi:mannose-6-phosphate isomerase-like protein (cupin superfamily)